MSGFQQGLLVIAPCVAIQTHLPSDQDVQTAAQRTLQLASLHVIVTTAAFVSVFAVEIIDDDETAIAVTSLLIRLGSAIAMLATGVSAVRAGTEAGCCCSCTRIASFFWLTVLNVVIAIVSIASSAYSHVNREADDIDQSKRVTTLTMIFASVTLVLALWLSGMSRRLLQLLKRDQLAGVV